MRLTCELGTIVLFQSVNTVNAACFISVITFLSIRNCRFSGSRVEQNSAVAKCCGARQLLVTAANKQTSFCFVLSLLHPLSTLHHLNKGHIVDRKCVVASSNIVIRVSHSLPLINNLKELLINHIAGVKM